MNKIEKIICLALGAVLAWYIWAEMGKSKERAAEQAKQVQVQQAKAAVAATNGVESVSGSGKDSASPVAAAPKAGDAESLPLPKEAELPSVPEKVVTLENEQLKLELSSWGAVVRKATLKGYAKECGEISETNPAVVLDFTASPLGELGGVPGLAANAAYEVRDCTSNTVVFVNAVVTRKITLGRDFQVTYEETFHSQPQPSTSTYLSLGAMAMGNSKNDQLSVDSWAMDSGKGKQDVIHHYEGDSPLKPFLVGGYSGGCSGGCSGGSSSAAGMPRAQSVKYPGAQKWIALKNRFFVTAMCSSTSANGGFEATIARDMREANYRPDSISAKAVFADVPEKRTTVFFVGPKKQSLLWDLGMKEVMDFGMWRWICYPIVYILNLFNGWIPNYGIAIILLTIFVRLIFWPLTHKSTVGMKRMQEIQPLMKEIQAKYKDNPQRLQQETWQLYKDHKVNPLSSCLPMLIQIPVFIALFNVLRCAVELRYAGFLWIADLSEPEGLFAAYLPFGGLNILPILMAVSTGLQSYFTPSAGDKNQQKMMTVFMPVMMLVMFYSFPAALSLYWFLSNLFSIVQMWLIRRQTAAAK